MEILLAIAGGIAVAALAYVYSSMIEEKDEKPQGTCPCGMDYTRALDGSRKK